jgi:hypothetical protein
LKALFSSVKSHKPVLFVGAALAALCVCALAAVLAGTYVPRMVQAGRPTPVPPTASPTATLIRVETPTAPPPTATATPSGLSANIAAQMDAIQGQVVELRGLHPTGPVERALLTPDELRQRVLEDFLTEYGPQEAAGDAQVYWLLGLMEPGFDLWNLYLELYSEQVAGYYDHRAKKMYVVRGGAFGGPERLTYAHEYAHALQDMNFDFRGGLNYTHASCRADSQRCAALRALLEGDATLLQEQWLRTYATQQDLTELLESIDTFQSPVFDAAPRFLQQNFLFPYTRGYSFVQHLYRRGGWAAVDRAYLDPPLSAEQVLHPEKYPGDRPVGLTLPDLLPALGGGWREVKRSALGEWFTRLVLEEFLPSEEARAAAAGWGGDVYGAYAHEGTGGAALVLVAAWDSVGEAAEFLAALQRYGDLRFGPGSRDGSGYAWAAAEGYRWIERSGDQTLWILAPDEAFGGALREAVEFPATRK